MFVIVCLCSVNLSSNALGLHSPGFMTSETKGWDNLFSKQHHKQQQKHCVKRLSYCTSLMCFLWSSFQIYSQSLDKIWVIFKMLMNPLKKAIFCLWSFVRTAHEITQVLLLDQCWVHHRSHMKASSLQLFCYSSKRQYSVTALFPHRCH